MSFIYEPKGKAREYGELAVNLYIGCSHGCKYCYVPLIRRKKANDCLEVSERKNILSGIKKELSTKKFIGKEIFLCFMCDPYAEGYTDLTRKAILEILSAKSKVNILSKAGANVLNDIDIFIQNRDNVKIGATVTLLENSEIVEPFAASSRERLLRQAKIHEQGIFTWLSLEPVLDTEEAKKIIIESKSYIDLYKVGKWNYSPKASKINWRKFAIEVIELLEKYNKQYYIKEDLRKFLL